MRSMNKYYLMILMLLLQYMTNAKGTDYVLKAKLPFSFRENKGQITDQFGHQRPDIRFALHSGHMTVFVGNGQLHYQFYRQENAVRDPVAIAQLKKMRLTIPHQVSTYRMDVVLVGADLSSPVVTSNARQDVEYYYLGTEQPVIVKSYEKVTYRNVYPNIDWQLYTKDNELKYDFIVHPGGNVKDIRLHYDGAKSITLAGNGSVNAATPYGIITEQRPYAYQLENKKTVASSFSLTKQELGFNIDTYQGTLIVDPGVEWATYFGDSGDEEVAGVVCDEQGYIYMSGNTTSMSNIATTGSYQETFGGGFGDAYLAKFDSTGTRLWATYYGGNSANFGYENVKNIACDHAGHIYLVGMTTSTDGIATTGSYQDTLTTGNIPLFGSLDGFLVQFDYSGMRQWGTYYGAAGADIFTSLDCDDAGNVYMAGYADLTGGLASPGAYQTIPAGGATLGDGILVKFNSSGVRQWATYYGGIDDEDVEGVACDASGTIYMSGYTTSASGIATAGTHQSTLDAAEDGFIVAFNSSGTPQWGTYYGGSSGDYINALAIDRNGGLYVAGFTESTNGIATSGSYQPLLGGDGTTASAGDHFLAKFDNTGQLSWGTYYGGTGTELPYACKVACDTNGNVYLAGETFSDNSPLPSILDNLIATPGSHQPQINSSGAPDNYIAWFDASGNRKWATYYGGDDYEDQAVLACDGVGNLYFAAQTQSTNDIATPGSFQPASAGGYEASLVRFVPIDLMLAGVAQPTNDTVCTGVQDVSLTVNNLGRHIQTDTVFASISYTGPSVTGIVDTFSTTMLAPGASANLSFGSFSFPSAGAYDFTAYLVYTTDDSSWVDDTLHFAIVAIDAPSVAGITYNVNNNIYTFNATNVQGATDYHWDFGDTQTDNNVAPTHSYTNSGTYTVTLIVSNLCSSDTVTTTVDAIGTGVNNITIDNLVTVFPNPSHGLLFIKAPVSIESESYGIYNLLGQEVQSGNLNNSRSIRIGNIPDGNYIIEITTNQGKVHKQIRITQ